MNENQPVYKSFNSQEIPFKLGNYLCHIMMREGIESEDMMSKDPYKRQILKDPDTLDPINYYEEQMP